jgi:hypothetical protein
MKRSKCGLICPEDMMPLPALVNAFMSNGVLNVKGGDAKY